MKFTFKKEPRVSGLAAIGNPNPDTQIKLNKKECGRIVGPVWSSTDKMWTIRFTVKKTVPDDNPNCDWKWVQFKKKFETEPEAREYITQNAEKILNESSLTLHYFEDD